MIHIQKSTIEVSKKCFSSLLINNFYENILSLQEKTRRIINDTTIK